jgi:hypothetical protein
MTMSGENFNVKIDGKPDGHMSRLAPGYAWEWQRATGECHVFDCGLAAAHVLDAIAVRLGIESRAVTASRTQ